MTAILANCDTDKLYNVPVLGLEIFNMENTTKSGAFHLPKTKLIKGIAFMLLAFALCRGPLLGSCFPAGISLIAYMLSKGAYHLYLLAPAAAGMLSCLVRGYDPWGELAAMAVCAIIFTAARHIRLSLWQRAAIAASIGIVCISIYRLATATVYKTSIELLLIEGLLIFFMVFLFDAFFGIFERDAGGRPEDFERDASDRAEQGAGHSDSRFAAESAGRGGNGFAAESAGHSVSGNPGRRFSLRPYAQELRLAAFTFICIMLMNGLGLSFLAWIAILFLALWVQAYADTGMALFVTASGGIMAALLEQAQWGLMATVMTGLVAASFVKKYGVFFSVVIFAAVCQALGSAESGVILGIDSYSLFLASAAFLALNWRFGSKMRRIMQRLFSGYAMAADVGDNRMEAVLCGKIAEMDDLAELYATYFDSRSVLANQFSITRQIIDDIRRQLGQGERRAALQAHERFQVDLAISQCAASGAINGDCCGWQDIGDGKTAMVVSDGMGKGKKAAAESLMVTKTIISLLRAGVSTDLTLKMINTIRLMKEDEDFYATVDLITIDRKTGNARFYKIGAAPTLIRRKSNVEEVKLSALPLGIVNGLKIRYVETTLKKDDWIIMMSDGVSDGGDSLLGAVTGADGRRRDAGSFLGRIKETAASVRSKDPQAMSDLILNQAADSYIGKERDDLTVMVAHIL